MSALARQVADRVGKLRMKRSLTQGCVGTCIGRSASYISNIENQRGEADFGLSEIEKLAAFFEVHPLTLLAGLSDSMSELVDRLSKMDPPKQKLAVKMFTLNLEMMEVTKNWPADSVNRV